MSDATVILGRDGMGSEADEADFEAWVRYVSDRIDERTGLDLAVETRHERDVLDTDVQDADPEDRDTIREALQSLWEDFCEDTSAWPART